MAFTPDRTKGSERSFRIALHFRRALQNNAMFLFLSAIYIAVGLVLSLVYEIRYSLLVYNLLWLAAAGLVFFMAYSANAGGGGALAQMPVFAPREGRGWRFRVYKRIAVAAPVFLVFPLFISSFTSIKASIGEINPYALDHLLMTLDQYLHGGSGAWRLIHPLVGYPVVTATLSIVYQAWFPILALVVVAMALWTERTALRSQFLVALVLTWAILGTVFPLLFPAGGPCFYGLLYPERHDPFEPLMTYLMRVDGEYPLRVLDLQETLWSDFEADELQPGSGISATPSMHVSIAMLNLMLARRISRWLAAAAAIFLVLTLLATIHLGWHYAIDGYIAIAAVPLIWILAGRIASFNVRGERLIRVLDLRSRPG